MPFDRRRGRGDTPVDRAIAERRRLTELRQHDVKAPHQLLRVDVEARMSALHTVLGKATMSEHPANVALTHLGYALTVGEANPGRGVMERAGQGGRAMAAGRDHRGARRGLMPIPTPIDCWHPRTHASDHGLHPRTGRPVCQRCHPVAGGLTPVAPDPTAPARAPVPTIKALSLWQPWATLIAVGAKRVETRGYPAARLGLRAGQRIAIHAAKRDKELWICDEAPFTDYDLTAAKLPLGAIVATATLDRWSEMTADSIERLQVENPHEHAFGFYEPGRWAWVLSDVVALADPLPVRGRQGAFDVPVAGLSLV